MKKTVILLFLCLTANTFFGQKSDYAVTHIPAELIKADAVVRDYAVNYDIQSPSKATLRERRVITLLNDNTHLNTLYLHYDKFKKIEDISGRLYDADGKFIRKISKKKSSTKVPFRDIPFMKMTV